jgi:hypothetical protein
MEIRYCWRVMRERGSQKSVRLGRVRERRGMGSCDCGLRKNMGKYVELKGGVYD